MKFSKFAAAAFGIGFLGLSTAGAHAANTVPASLTAGTDLSVSGGTSTGFTATLAGVDQNVYSTLTPIVVTDDRATGAGWHVTVQATAFTGPHTLVADSLLLNTVGVACDVSSNCSLPSSVNAGTVSLDHATATQLASAASTGEGMGVIDISAPNFPAKTGNLNLAVPGKAYAGAYSSSLTISVITGP